MQKKVQQVSVLSAGIALILLLSIINIRFDFTTDGRYTLTQPTQKVLASVVEPVRIDVFLTGELPADYKKLSLATEALLQEFATRAPLQVQFKELPLKSTDSSDSYLLDSLVRLGVVFERSTESEGTTICPSAVVYNGKAAPVAIDLRSAKKVFKAYNIVTDVPQEDVEATRNAAEALLEYKFINAIDKVTRTYVPTIAYVVGNGEPIDLTVNDLGESLRNNYRLGVFDLKKGFPNPQQIDALLIVKPTQAFTEDDKLKLDQYLMGGGKLIWCIDRLYAELDSLMRSNADFVAFDRNLNLDDVLFKYGVRINTDLVLDLNCSKVPIVVGYNPDRSPIMQRMPWPYYPFAMAQNSPITKNVDRVLTLFPSSIDTVKATGIKKTVLLASDTNSRIIGSPAMVKLKTIETESDFGLFNKSAVPIAVLLEGSFNSLYANTITQAQRDTILKQTGQEFKKSGKPSQQIVIADADVVTNAVSKTTGPLPMGMLAMENYTFANKDFFLNSVDYLIGKNQLYVARNKEVTLRLLDKEKIEQQKTSVQLLAVGLPISLVVLLGFVLQYFRKRTYGSK
jgi:ABC-2 type transport system permease protein